MTPAEWGARAVHLLADAMDAANVTPERYRVDVDASAGEPMVSMVVGVPVSVNVAGCPAGLATPRVTVSLEGDPADVLSQLESGADRLARAASTGAWE